MNKRGKSGFIKSVCSFEIILFISLSFALAFILNGSLVSGQAASDAFYTNPWAKYASPKSTTLIPNAAAPPPADPAAGGGPLEGLKAGVGKVFSGEATLGFEAGSTAAGFVGTLIGALAWAGRGLCCCSDYWKPSWS